LILPGEQAPPDPKIFQFYGLTAINSLSWYAAPFDIGLTPNDKPRRGAIYSRRAAPFDIGLTTNDKPRRGAIYSRRAAPFDRDLTTNDKPRQR